MIPFHFSDPSMPVRGSHTLRPISPEQFAELDYGVIRAAFECRNQLGRLCDEAIYENDLAARITAAGLSAV
jgi:hypothetical protein